MPRRKLVRSSNGYRTVAGLVAWVGVLLIGALPLQAGSIRQPGIDVSSYQDTINWTSVKASGIDFAFIKATEGMNTVDPDFAYNIANAKAAGVLAGCYHLCYPELSGHTPAVEANHFLATAKPYIVKGYLQPVLDLEEGGGDTIVGAANMSDWVNDWCADVKAATGVDPIIYCNTNYAESYLNSSVTIHRLWIANYNGVNPDNGSSVNGVWGTTWSFFQHSDAGTVSGVPDAVDLDSFNGTVAQLDALVIPEPSLLMFGAAGLLDDATPPSI